MKHYQYKQLAGMVLIATSTTANAFIINLDYTYDTNSFFSTNANAANLMSTAASFFESRITDDLLAINSGSEGSMTATFSHTGTGAPHSIDDFSVAANTITVFVGARSLGGGTLALGGPGGYGASGTQNFLDTVEFRGEAGNTNNPGATEFAPWGGQITFDNDGSTAWDFDSSDGITGSDFYSVALHELGHVLGLGTADSWDDLVSGGEFTGANAVAANGGNNVILHGDNAHWAPGTSSLVDGITPQEAAMDPNLTNGTQKLFTDLDMAALDDIGWDIAASPVPLPAAVWLFGSGLLGIIGLRKRQRKPA